MYFARKEMWETPEPGTWRLNAEYMEGLLTSASL